MPIVSVAIFVFLLYCVLDVALSPSDDVRNFPKLVWLVLVVLLPVIGGVAWLVAGRPERSGRAPGGGPPAGRTAPPRGTPGGYRPQAPPPSGGSRRPRGPDDDPEFLRRLGENLDRPEDD